MQNFEAEAATSFETRFVAITDVEIVDIPQMIKNETKVTVGGVFDEATTDFTHIEVIKNRGSPFFAIADSTGHISTLIKNLRLKSRIHSDGNKVVELTSHGMSLLIVHPMDVAFSGLSDNKISPFYCEGSFKTEESFTHVSIEKYRPTQNYLYVMTS